MTSMRSSSRRIVRIFLVVSVAWTAVGSAVGASWVERINGTGNTNDVALAVATRDDAVFIAGSIFEDVGMGGSKSHGLISRLNRVTGQQVWTLSWLDPDDPGDFVFCRQIVLDTVGDLIVGCDFGYDDFGVLKVSAAGTVLWWQTLPSDGSLPSFGGITIDDLGRIYLAGRTVDSAGGAVQVLVGIYEPDGSVVHSFVYSGPTGSAGSNAAGIVATSSDIWIAGYTELPDLSLEASVVRFTSTGSVVWERFFGGEGFATDDVFRDLAVRPESGQVVAAGSMNSGTANGTDALVVAIDLDGSVAWQAFGDTEPGIDDSLRALVLLPSGDVVAVGSLETGLNESDPLVMRWSPTGVERWRRQAAGAGTDTEAAVSVAVGPGEDVCVGGYASLANDSYGFLHATYDAVGTQRDYQTYAGPLGGGSRAWSVAVDPTGRCIAAGGSFGVGTGEDATVIQFDPPILFEDGFESGDLTAW
ncbi:MAG: hypothetical protein K8J08_12405 [Thermoanaerobaculia bacterium]|nr:hypothetical protein [Thermoanaerobaculia bacterium]